ncbi:MAG: heparinase II/III-family protein, partial [Planctomycetes bacterium]|nr:heparinase II/III-family protein [Planctomycetota bacterium]
AVLFDRPDFKLAAGGYYEPARWLLGRDGRKKFDALDATAVPRRIGPIALRDAGYYILQAGRRDADDRISVVFDCGPLGYPATAAHGHADALSFTLRAFGMDVLVDPGTYDYYTYPKWRRYFRSTRAHNTIAVDGLDQSVIQGRFLWGKRARARCLLWQPGERDGKVVGEHDGYRRLADPVTHRRTIEFDGRARTVLVRDELLCRGEHDVEIFFHFAEHCRVVPAGANRFVADVGPGEVSIQLDASLAVTVLAGSEEPPGGWVSRGYHRKEPATTLVGRRKITGQTQLLCRIEISPPGGSGGTDRRGESQETTDRPG